VVVPTCGSWILVILLSVGMDGRSYPFYILYIRFLHLQEIDGRREALDGLFYCTSVGLRKKVYKCLRKDFTLNLKAPVTTTKFNCLGMARFGFWGYLPGILMMMNFLGSRESMSILGGWVLQVHSWQIYKWNSGKREKVIFQVDKWNLQALKA